MLNGTFATSAIRQARAMGINSHEVHAMMACGHQWVSTPLEQQGWQADVACLYNVRIACRSLSGSSAPVPDNLNGLRKRTFANERLLASQAHALEP